MDTEYAKKKLVFVNVGNLLRVLIAPAYDVQKTVVLEEYAMDRPGNVFVEKNGRVKIAKNLFARPITAAITEIVTLKLKNANVPRVTGAKIAK